MDPNKLSSSGSGLSKLRCGFSISTIQLLLSLVPQQKQLLYQCRELLARRSLIFPAYLTRLKSTASVQVAYGPGASISTSNIYGDSTNDNNVESRMLSLMKAQHNVTSVAKDEPYERDERLMDIDGASASENEGNYTEPWSHENPQVPLHIPWMRPNSSAPEIMDKDESEENGKTLK
ncbi:hypothetical protein AKJ16_DCAP12426 [Drosera capensis]